MGRVLTNNTSLEVAREASLGTLPGTPTWDLMEPEGINTFGATVSTVARNPISKNRQRRKGTVTDLDSAVEFEHDLTMHVIRRYLDGFMFADYVNADPIFHLQSGANFQNLIADASLAVAAVPGYAHDALAQAIPAGTLIYSRGYTNVVNNGLDEVISGGSTTETPTLAADQVDEAATEQQHAQLDVAGFRFTDLTWTDATNTIGSAGTDMTTLGWQPGQLLRIGNPDATNEFAGGSITGRIVSIAAAATVLDKVENVVQAGVAGTVDGGGDVGATTVDVLYGQFIKNVAVDDALFQEISFQFEAAYLGLGNPSGDRYEYAIGNLCNQLQLNVPLTEKSTATFGFIGTDTEAITSSRKTNAATPLDPVQTTALNTSSDIARLRVTEVDETGLSTCFKNMTVTLNNNVSPEKCLGTLGAVFMNTGNFEVDIESQALFTEEAVTSAIKANRTVTMDFLLKNDDGGLALDIPAMTLGDGNKEFPVNESVLINLTAQAHQDPTLGYSLAFSLFPFLPADD